MKIIPPLRGRALRERMADNEACFAPSAPQYWLRDRADGPRRAGVSAMSVDGNCLHVVMEAASSSPLSTAAMGPEDDRRQPLGAPDEALFAVSADDVAALLERLDELSHFTELHATDGAEPLARRWWSTRSDARALSVAIIARDGGELRELVALAREHVQTGRASAGERVFYSPQPLRQGTLAFVFPGEGNYFPGMARDLSAAWPEVLRRQDAENQRLASQFAAAQFWTGRALDRITHRDSIFAQVWAGTVVSDLLCSFGVKPAAVIGYSLGETTGLFATRAWTARDAMLERLRASTLFTSDLTGRSDAVRRAWNLGEDESVDWRAAIVDRSADEVRRALKGRERVYLLIVNTPGECVIGGDRHAVESLARDLGCAMHPIRGVTTVHCAVARPVEEAYRDLHLLPTTPPPGVSFYSGAWGKAYEVTRENAADAIVAQAVEPFDFTRVVNAAYADGVRVFRGDWAGGNLQPHDRTDSEGPPAPRARRVRPRAERGGRCVARAGEPGGGGGRGRS